MLLWAGKVKFESDNVLLGLSYAPVLVATKIKLFGKVSVNSRPVANHDHMLAIVIVYAKFSPEKTDDGAVFAISMYGLVLALF